MAKWESYEEVAACLIDQFAYEFGLERVEGKQEVIGKGVALSPPPYPTMAEMRWVNEPHSVVHRPEWRRPLLGAYVGG